MGDSIRSMGGSIRSNRGRRRSSTGRMDNSSLAPQSPRKRQREPVPAAERKQPIPRRPAGVIGTSSYYSVPLLCVEKQEACQSNAFLHTALNRISLPRQAVEWFYKFRRRRTMLNSVDRAKSNAECNDLCSWVRHPGRSEGSVDPPLA